PPPAATRPVPVAGAAPIRRAPPPCPPRPHPRGQRRAPQRAPVASGAAARSPTEPGRNGRRSPRARRVRPRATGGSPSPEGDVVATPTKPPGAFRRRRTRGGTRLRPPAAFVRPRTTAARRHRRPCP